MKHDGADGYTLDVSVWKRGQKRYLVHGTDDVVWTDSIDEAIEYLRQELDRIEQMSDWQKETAAP